MAQITYTVIASTSENESQDNASNEAEAVKTALENAISELKFSSGQAQIRVLSLSEN